MNKESSYEFLRLFNRGYDKEEVSDPYYKNKNVRESRITRTFSNTMHMHMQPTPCAHNLMDKRLQCLRTYENELAA